QASLGLAMRAAIPDDAIIVDESCQVGYWSRSGVPVYEPRTYLTSGYQGTLGWGFPTALGAKIGNPDRKVISFNGDGGFMFNVQNWPPPSSTTSPSPSSSSTTAPSATCCAPSGNRSAGARSPSNCAIPASPSWPKSSACPACVPKQPRPSPARC